MAADDAGPTRSLLGPVLVVSLMINLVVLGAIAGTVLASREGAGWFAQTCAKQGFLDYVRTLPAERRDALTALFMQKRQGRAPLRAHVQAAKAEARAVLATDPLDRAELVAAFDRIDSAEGKLRSAFLKDFAEIFERMSAQDRRGFKEWRERNPHEWGRYGADRD